MTAALTQAVQRLRTLSAEMAAVPEAEREARVKSEVASVMKTVDGDGREELLDGLLDAFPVWPPDIKPPPPPPPLTDEEMVQKLSQKAQSSEAERLRITGLLRAGGIGGGLSEPQSAELRRLFNLSATAQPDLGRVIDVLTRLARLVDQLEKPSKEFLRANGVVLAIGAAPPRMAEVIARLLPMPDSEGARHARQAEMDNAGNVLLVAIHVLSRFCQKYSEELAEKYSPAVIESAKQGGMMKAGKWWEEYINRLGGQRERAGVKAELEGQMSRRIQQLVREIQ